LVARAVGHDALLISSREAMTADTLAALPASIRAIATFSVGFEHIDLAAAKARGMVVTNTPDVLTDATADIAMLLILGAARRAGEGERMVRNDSWIGLGLAEMLGRQVSGARLGILGMGRIGRALARRATASGYRPSSSRAPPSTPTRKRCCRTATCCPSTARRVPKPAAS
jgi:glyoxylate reductase